MASAIYILLPAYNEESALQILIPDLTKALMSLGRPFIICVVDDGSRDKTAEVVRSFPNTQMLTHTVNQGYGAGIRTGVTWIAEHAKPEDVVVTMDADNTQPPSSISTLIQKLDQGADVVTASYRIPGGEAKGVPFKRKFLSGGANLLFKLRFRFPGLGTYTNGFRAYRVSALQQAVARFSDKLIKETNFAGGTELFIKVLLAGARPGEVPFVLDYGRRGGASKINISRTVKGYLRLLCSSPPKVALPPSDLIQ